jgi:hypothetical protein
MNSRRFTAQSSQVLATSRIARLDTQETAALRDFNPANARFGSKAEILTASRTSALPRIATKNAPHRAG